MITLTKLERTLRRLYLVGLRAANTGNHKKSIAVLYAQERIVRRMRKRREYLGIRNEEAVQCGSGV